MSDGVKIKRQRSASVEFRKFGEVNLKSDGNTGESSFAEYSVGFDLKSGALKSGAGLGELWNNTIAEKCVGLWFYKRYDQLRGASDRLIAMSESGQMYEKRLTAGPFYQISGLVFSQKPEGVCYNYNGDDVIIFASGEDGTFIYDGNQVTSIPSAPPITSACMHYERLFVTVEGGRTLWFSDDFDPTNWSVSLSEAGFIDLVDFRGEMLKALSFLDYLYVFRSYGITRISAYGKQEEFTVSNLFTSSGKILKNSITVCGDRIIFFASDGIYSFNGLTATKIFEGLDGFVDYSYEQTKGQYFDGKAYFMTKIHKGDVLCDALMIIEVFSGTYYFIEGLGIVDIQLIDGRSAYELAFLDGAGIKVFRLDGKGGKLGIPYRKEWKSKFGDFGIRKKKNLTEVSLFTATRITLEVNCDGKTFQFDVPGGEERKAVRPNIRGYKFSFKIICEEENADVSALTVNFGYYL
ncbi:MAG: hypothetical protein IJ800_05100 [Clostridia bacterium]|nr:hypothetical protein [Clostridia bacterium]